MIERGIEATGASRASLAERHLCRAGGNRIAGSISDAIGPATKEIRGNVFHLDRPPRADAAVEWRSPQSPPLAKRGGSCYAPLIT